MTLSLPDRLIARTRTSIVKAVAYLCRKQSYNGAFCFYRYEHADHPNLRDTYRAIAALRLAGAEIPRADELLQYLNGLELCDLSALFHYAFSLERLGGSALIREPVRLQIGRLPLKRPDDIVRIPSERWLESTLQTVLLQQSFAGLTANAEVVRAIGELKGKEGGYGDNANLWDTYLSLSILTVLGDNSLSREDTRVFVDRLQRSSSGFTATLDSSHTNLPIIAAGMRCCTLLGLPVRHRADILTFVLACQSADGSFSRAPVALPNIELTHQALTIIDALDPGLLSVSADSRTTTTLEYL
jgi:hypothetical protein